jgi:hypothetical protein
MNNSHAQENNIVTVETVETVETVVVKTKKEPKTKKPQKPLNMIVRFLYGKKIIHINFNLNLDQELVKQISFAARKYCHQLVKSKDVSVLIDGCNYEYIAGFTSVDTKILVQEFIEAAKFALVGHYTDNARLELRNEGVLRAIGAKHPMLKEDALSLIGFSKRVVSTAVTKFSASDKRLKDERSNMLLPDTHLQMHYTIQEEKAVKRLAVKTAKQIAQGK